MTQRTLPATCSEKGCEGTVKQTGENANQYDGVCTTCGMPYVVRKGAPAAKGKGKGKGKGGDE